MTNFENYKTDDFIHDSTFIKWVVKGDDESERFWNNYIKDHPSQEQSIEEARKFICMLRVVEPEVSVSRLEKLETRIKNGQKGRGRLRTLNILRYAAGILLIVALGVTVRFLLIEQDVEFDTLNNLGDHAQVILPDGTVKSFENNESQIIQDEHGNLVVNTDTIIGTSYRKVSDGQNRLVVPYGKTSELYLPDGTHIYVNSGSKISFPTKFTGKRRVIYLEGEAYLNVKSDKEHPFVVHTKNSRIMVTGTSFNVSAYADEQVDQTVLVEGVVTFISKHGIFKDRIKMEPGQSVWLDRSSGKIVSREVDLNKYTSWINGYLVFKNESLCNVFKKLERFYNKEIICDKQLKDISFSGKLDLTKQLEEVLETVEYASSIMVFKKDDKYIIKH
ncbi:DUF4974 domain-containing protein [Puteibacter caeruleilacunae]|nr:DUF4974 domain-containing protein [Puteibacter caeruleilacunae]